MSFAGVCPFARAEDGLRARSVVVGAADRAARRREGAIVSVPSALLAQLKDARCRGEPFEDAWGPALVSALRCAESGVERAAWSAALSGTRASWSAAYEFRPAAPIAQAMGRLLDHDRHIAIGRSCLRCGEEIPTDAHGTRKYCSPDCRDAAAREREGARAGVLVGA